MGSNRLSRTRIINDKDFLTIKSSSSNSMIESASNRGKYVENSALSCGKNDKKCGKLSEKCGKLTSKQAEARANALIAIFNAPQCREFFLKCIYHLTSDEIKQVVDYANRPQVISPVRYFNKVCKTKLAERGY